MNISRDAETLEGRNLLEVRDFVRLLLEDVAAQMLALRASGTMAVEEKDGGQHDGKKFDIVTEADTLAENLIVAALKEQYPYDSITGEEEGAQGGEDAEWHWEIDPIDGTLNFRSGDQCGISVGLLHRGQPVMGVIHFLHDNSQMYAAKGNGAFLYDCGTATESALHVASDPSTEVPSRLYLAGDIGHGDLEAQMQALAAIRRQAQYITSDACYLTSTRRVLTGQRDAYVNAGAKSYDMAASIAIALEAGAVVSGIKKDVDLRSRDVIPTIIARNAAIVEQIKAALKD